MATYKIPKKLLFNEYRREMWKNVEKMLKIISKNMPITGIEVAGSFTTKKKRPVDIDFTVLLKTPLNNKKKWSVDLVIAPDNEHGKFIAEDIRKWASRKYGKNNHQAYKIK
jgi:hypothetical protein